MLSAPLLGLFGLTTPLIARSFVRRKVKAVRQEFADQFPGSLQVLASALRSGHSFNGALGVVVDHAHEPARAELARVLQDDRLGVLPEDAIRKLARRMANRDIEQVALLAELQRTSGGNSAEILDTVVGTIRERAEIRRLVRTLTAQGRMARWILTALPDRPHRLPLARPPGRDGELLHEQQRADRVARRGPDGRGRLAPHPKNRRHRRLGALT